MADSFLSDAMSGIGWALSPLDYPRQALWNLGRQPARVLSGQAPVSDLAGAIPGLVGAGLAGGLVASGVGAPLGILLGAAAGGLGQGLGKLGGGDAFTAPTTGELAEQVGFDQETNPWGHAAASLGIGLATDPLTYSGTAGLLRGSNRFLPAAKAAGEGGSEIGTLRQLLSGKPVFKNIRPIESPELADFTVRQSEMLAEGARPRFAVSPRGEDGGGWLADVAVSGGRDPSDAFERAMDVAEQHGSTSPHVMGAYVPSEKATLLYENARPGLTSRHERTHNLVRSAMEQGKINDLPPIARPAAWLKSSAQAGQQADQFRYTLGHIADELAAATLEGRGTANQINAGANFLFPPPNELFGRAGNYASLFSETSPAAGAIYRGLNFAPYALHGAAAANRMSPLAEALR